MRPVFEWQIGSRALQLGKRTLIMGVVMSRPTHFLTAACILILNLPWPMRYNSWRMAQTSSTSEANPLGREQRLLLRLGQAPLAAARKLRSASAKNWIA